jgi:hypothetical protein
MMTSPRPSRVASRRSIILGADQGVSSVSNFIATLAVASIATPAQFGAYALGGSLFALALAATRMTSSERLVLETDRRRASIATDSMLFVGAVSTVASVVLWGIVGDPTVLAWAAAALPILAQDRLRFVALSKRPGVAIAGDALWLSMTGVLWLAVELAGVSGGPGSVLITSVPPLVSCLFLAVFVRRDIALRVERDIQPFRSEFHFVLDPWIQAGAVFVAFGIAAAVGSLETVGQARALLLLFQPFVSISYVGRLIVLRSRDETRIRRWPTVAAGSCAVYSALVGVAALIARASGLEAGDLWSFAPASFVLMAVAQSARAFHQSVADLLRRSSPGRLVRARLTSAVLLVAGIGPLVAWRELIGLTGAWAAAYIGGALAIRTEAMSNPSRSSVTSVEANGLEPDRLSTPDG